MKVEEVLLPGVGRKYTITVKSGDRIVIVVHSSGKRELQYFEAGEEDEPTVALDLTDEEALLALTRIDLWFQHAADQCVGTTA